MRHKRQEVGAVRRGIGAILTTGLALVGATVVVANPVLAPPSDVRIPAVSLSADASASAGVLDPALLKAIAQYPAEPGPAELFKRLLAELVADAAVLGGQAAEGGLWARGAASAPAVALPAAPPPGLTPDLLGAHAFALATVDTRAQLPAAVAEDPMVQHTVNAIAANVGYLGRQVTAAALAAGTIVGAEPRLIAETFAALAKGDIEAAIRTVLQAVATPLAPPLIIVKAIGTLIGERLTELGLIPAPARAVLKPMGSAAAPVVVSGARAVPRTSLASSARPVASGRSARENLRQHLARPASTNGGTDLSDGNKVVPHRTMASASAPKKITAAVDQVRATADRFGAAVRQAIRSQHP